jgi:hypothetical protein
MSRPSGAKMHGKLPVSKAVIMSEAKNLGLEMFRFAQHDKKKSH